MQRSSLISGRVLAKSTMWNLTGLVTPMLVGVFAIPVLIDRFGSERFGLLAIIWMGIGYFSLFDLGLGRALTKLVAERLGNDDSSDIGELIWTALCTILALGVIGGVTVALVAYPVVGGILNVPPQLQVEGVSAFRVLAMGIPAVVGTAAVVGILEAHQRFGTIASIRIPLGALTFAAPLATSLFSPSLVWATWALLGARVLAFAIYARAAGIVSPELRRPRLPSSEHIWPLIHFGGWLTVSNIVGPLMVYFDRVLIGATITMTAVTYYVTPFEVLSRLQLIPKSVVAVLFPALSTAFSEGGSRLGRLYDRADRIVFGLSLPVMGTAFLMAPEALELWLGEDFRKASTVVVRWLSLGWTVNALALVPFTMLQSVGRPDIVAKIHLVEVLPYGAALWVFTTEFGIAGASAAWCLRVIVDMLALNLMAGRHMPELWPSIRRNLGSLFLLGASAWAVLGVASTIGRGVMVVGLVAYAASSLGRFVNPLIGR